MLCKHLEGIPEFAQTASVQWRQLLDQVPCTMQPYGPQPHLGNFGEQAIQEQLLPYSTVCSGDVLLNIDRRKQLVPSSPSQRMAHGRKKQCYGAQHACRMHNCCEDGKCAGADFLGSPGNLREVCIREQAAPENHQTVPPALKFCFEGFGCPVFGSSGRQRLAAPCCLCVFLGWRAIDSGC